MLSCTSSSGPSVTFLGPYILLQDTVHCVVADILISDHVYTHVLARLCLRVKNLLQVHVKVALKPMVQGVSKTEDALELLEYISACGSLQLRGLSADYGLPKVSAHSTLCGMSENVVCTFHRC